MPGDYLKPGILQGFSEDEVSVETDNLIIISTLFLLLTVACHKDAGRVL